MRYVNHFKTTETRQSQPIHGTTQVENSAGGFSWAVNDWTRLDRFLVLGNEGGSYYATEKAMTIKNAEAALRCIQADGRRTVQRLVDISEAGRAPKNDPCIFVLALAASKGNDATRRLALEMLPRVCRTGTHLFQFLETVQGFRGWGRGLRRAIGAWYRRDDIAYQLVKYRQRQGWTHKDALRLSKPALGTQPDLQWVVGKPTANVSPLIDAFQRAETAEKPHDIVQILADCPSLPWEAIPSQFLGSPEVWSALLPHLPITALIRNLGRMTANGLLKPLSDAAKQITGEITNAERIRAARIHPIAVLGAMKTYEQGHGVKGSLQWEPVASIVDALDAAFYLAFGNVEPANKRILLALDVSGSMNGGTIASMPGITPRVGSSAMAMVTARSEPEYAVMAFSQQFIPLPISPRQRLDDICKMTEQLPFSGTDCALPMLWALQHQVKIDTFCVYTDSETWAGAIHPSQALTQYRQKMGIPSKLVVVGMVANEFTIADPNDAGMLDVVGFDTATPNLIRDFSANETIPL